MVREVRRICQDKIKPATGKRREAIRLDELDAARGVVCAGDRKCGSAAVNRGHTQIRTLSGHREGDGTAASSPVEHCGTLRCKLDGPLDEVFSLRSRYQHIGRNVERKAPETPSARDVGDRLTRCPSGDQRSREIQFRGNERTLTVGIEHDPFNPEGVREENLRVEACGAKAPLGEVGGRAGENLRNGERQESVSARATRLGEDKRLERPLQKFVKRVDCVQDARKIADRVRLTVGKAQVELRGVGVHRLD